MFGVRKWKQALICLILFIPSVLMSQEPGQDQRVRIVPELKRTTILIGEQTDLKVRLIFPSDATATLVLPEDTLVHGVEIIRTDLVDSLSINDELRELVYKVVITSFDSATYRLENINALVSGYLYGSSEEVSLMVNTLPVDLEQPDVYADIKDQWKPKFVWQDYLLYLYILLGLVLLGIGIYFLVRFLKKRRSIQDNEEIKEVYMDPYEEAMQGIILLKSKELWEHNQVKQYYTELTDILRKYLLRVYGINTAEKTSEEILAAFRTLIGRERMYQELSNILGTADMAKFAKYLPSTDDNIRLLFTAQEFIEEHKPASDDSDNKEGGEEL